jgi:cardiolipin-specific phospholipase
MVQLSGKNRAIHEIAISRPEPTASSAESEPENTLVMLHGYGAGLGFFYRNLEPLSRPKGWKLYALDMLGMGNSSRPPFRIHAKDQQGKITEAENWFIDALEEWRIARKLEKFTLLGHSMGGYLAVSYALKYPGRLNKLILASPVGMPEDPYAVSAPVPQNEGQETAMANELMDQEGSSLSASVSRQTDPSAAASSSGANATDTKPKRRPQSGWWLWLWDANLLSPFSLVRMAGPFGPRVVSGWTSRRFDHLPAEEAAAMHSYVYTVFRQRGSGEFALPYLLAPGAYARRPMINYIQEVGRKVIKPATDTTPALKETGIPIVMMYGDHDWMDVAGGYAAEEKLRQAATRALLHGTEEEKRKENGSAKVKIISKAGHHLYLENPDDFNDFVVKELEETRRETLRNRARDTVRERRQAES